MSCAFATGVIVECRANRDALTILGELKRKPSLVSDVLLDKVVVTQTRPAGNKKLRSKSEHTNDSVFVPVCVIVEGADGKAFSPDSRHRELPAEPVPVGISLDTIAKIYPRIAVEFEDAHSTLLGVGPERSTNCDKLSIVRQRDGSAEMI